MRRALGASAPRSAPSTLATLRTEAVASDALVLHDASGRTASLRHWSFEQLAGYRRRAAEIPPDVARADRL